MALGEIQNAPTATAGGGGSPPSKTRRGSTSPATKRRGSTTVVGSQHDWVALQRKTFTRWCNMYVAKRGFVLEDLNTDLADGLALHALLGEISNSSLPRILKKPRLRIQKMENVGVCLKWLTTGDHALKLVGIGASDLVDGVEKLILGLVWTIILRFEVANADGKAGLLLWCKRSTQGYDGVDVRNFTNSWADGKALMALINRYRPDLMKFDPSDSASNLEQCFKVAEEELGIARLLDVEDVADNPRPDEKSVVAYLSQFFKLFAGAAKEDALVKCVERAVGVTRRHTGWIQQYNDGAGELLAWVQNTAAEHAHGGDEGLGDATAVVYDKLRKFRNHLRDDKPARQQQKLEQEGVYSLLRSSKNANARPAFEPQIKPATVQVCWEAMEAADRSYEQDLRDRLVRFQRADAETARFRAKASNAGAWLDAKGAFFEAELPLAEDGDVAPLSLADLEAREIAHSAFEKRFEQYRGVLRNMRKIADTVPARAEGHAAAAAMPDAVRALELQAEAVETQAGHYHDACARGLERERALVAAGRAFDKDADQLTFMLGQAGEDLDLPVGANGSGGVAGVGAIRDATVALVPLKATLGECASRAADLQGQATTLAGAGAARREGAVGQADALLAQCEQARAAFEERKAALTGLLDEEEHKDALCARFATLANEFEAFVDGEKAKADAAIDADAAEGRDRAGTEEEKVDAANRRQQALRAHRDACAQAAVPLMANLEEAAQACEQAGVVVNPHTPHTVNGLRGAFEMLQKVLRRADEALSAQILADRSSEATPEQLKEIKEVFEHFDNNGNGTLDRQELIDGIQGVGIDMSDDEVEKKLKRLQKKKGGGGGGGDEAGELSCDFEQFTQFMLDQLKTGDGADAVKDAFRQLSDTDRPGKPAISKGAIDRFFGNSPDGLGEYLHGNMPQVAAEDDEGYDFAQFTTQLFAV